LQSLFSAEEPSSMIHGSGLDMYPRFECPVTQRCINYGQQNLL
jgi:hypothetical protein